MALTEIRVPDIGDFKDIPVNEVHVKAGDVVKRDDPLITLESDKAAMEVPSPGDGQIAEILLNVGDKVSMGVPILRFSSQADAPALPVSDGKAEPSVSRDAEAPAALSQPEAHLALELPIASDFGGVHAGPAVRRLARELAIDLTRVKGTGDKGRVTKDDVKRALAGSATPPSGPASRKFRCRTFPSSGPLKSSRCHVLGAFQAHICIVPGSISPTLHTPTKPISPSLKAIARRSIWRPRTRAIA